MDVPVANISLHYEPGFRDRADGHLATDFMHHPSLPEFDN